jgi:5-methyltetrahydrofolate--homocysteine methyltransferase
MAEVTSIPLIAKPNAGLPVTLADGSVGYAMTPNEFAEEMQHLVEAGATILGGCCGTSPAFIKALNEKYGDLSFEYCEEDDDECIEYITSERKILCIDKGFVDIGVRINACRDEELQDDLMDEFTDLILEYAEEQEDDGAEVLNINLDMEGIDVCEMMIRVIEDIQSVTTLPLSFESSDVKVIETALRHYPGRALVNTDSLNTENKKELLPIVEKYGAVFKK